MNPKVQSAPSFPVSIFIAGDYNVAATICREYCDNVGYCVTVTPTNYVYRGGSESGVVVGLINYPRFPIEPWEIYNHAQALAKQLQLGLDQESYTIQTPFDTVWYSCRPEDIE